MLVLTRRIGETILIGKDILITVLQIRRNGQVKVGITAPTDVPIMRTEILRNNTDATTSR